MEPAPSGPARPARVLVVAPAWVGDMVMAECLFALLKRRHPTARLDVLAPRWTLPLLKFMPEVDEGIPLPFGHGELKLGERRRLGRGLRSRGYDLALVLPGSLKSALVPYWSGATRRRGYGGPLRRLLLTETTAKPNLPQVESFLALGSTEQMDSLWRKRDLGQLAPEESCCPRLVVPPGAPDDALTALGLTRPAGPLLALAPGAEYGPAKRWPAGHFTELAAASQRAGWTVWLFGSGGDRQVTAAIPADADLAGRTSLDQAVALLALADVVVSNDSGLMHVAAAVGRPQVALFGPSDAKRTGPRNPRARILSLDLDCSPCNKRVCPLGHHRCLQDLTPQQVLTALPAR